VNNQQPAPLPASGANAPSKLAGLKPNNGQYTQEPGPSGMNINNLPLDEAEANGQPTPGRPGRPGRPATDVAGHAAKPGHADKEEDVPANPYKDAAAKADKEAPAAPPEEPELQPPPTEKPPPLDQRAPLNRASALTALSHAANSAAACKREGGPTGTGSASITFSPEGPVTAVNLSAPFAGTPVGACIQTVFKSAHVPAFSGSAVSLNKSFRIAD